MEGEPSGRGPWLSPPEHLPWPGPPLPDGGEAAGVALKHVGIIEHGHPRVSPSTTPLPFRSQSKFFRVQNSPNRRREGCGQVAKQVDPECQIKEPMNYGWIND